MAILDCAKDVISHVCSPSVGETSRVERVTSEAEHDGALFHEMVVSVNVSHAWALTVRDEVPDTLLLNRDNNAVVGVMAAGNGNSERSNVRIIFDSPDPPAEIPRFSFPLFPSNELGLLESIVASGT